MLPRVELRSKTELRIDAEIEPGPRATEYRAALRTVEGGLVWTGTGRPVGGDGVRVIVPASALRPGDYLLGIVPANRPAAEGTEYPFVVAGPASR
jgi:hypothetical protein